VKDCSEGLRLQVGIGIGGCDLLQQVQGLLNKLRMKNFNSISDQIITWVNKSDTEKDRKTLKGVIRLVFEKAIDDATQSEMYASLCRKMIRQISPRFVDDGVKDAKDMPIGGAHLFSKYLLNRCQEDLECRWMARDATAATAAAKAMGDQAAKAADEKSKDSRKTGDDIVLHSEEYYAAQRP
jgi:translation initiation factor 4G